MDATPTPPTSAGAPPTAHAPPSVAAPTAHTPRPLSPMSAFRALVATVAAPAATRAVASDSAVHDASSFAALLAEAPPLKAKILAGNSPTRACAVPSHGSSPQSSPLVETTPDNSPSTFVPFKLYKAAFSRESLDLYTDAAYRRASLAPVEMDCHGVLGIFIADPDPGPAAPCLRYSRLVVPQWVWHALAPDRVVRIMQAELLAMICVYWSLPDLFASRAVGHWCDNTAALTAATGGGAASFPGADLLTCMLHLALLHLRCDVYFDWIPSAANPADWPTRPDKEYLIPAEAVPFPLHMPPDFLFQSLMDPRAIGLWRNALSSSSLPRAERW
ncbi:hypothetical protein AB1Y20_015141 [Prymnesium parvum]|uniref:Uncharacterized protein n=1 Tax=Prymnesium parvum TaxID=97485 RepID=A0AB34JXK8_PRYPA